jgi:hypothetical protein
MRLFSLPILTFLFVFAFLLHSTNAGCYTNGLYAPLHQRAALIRDLPGICSRNFVRVHETTHNFLYCWSFINGENGHYMLYIYNNFVQPRYMAREGCVEFLLREIRCGFGGDRSYWWPNDAWRFM